MMTTVPSITPTQDDVFFVEVAPLAASYGFDQPDVCKEQEGLLYFLAPQTGRLYSIVEAYSPDLRVPLLLDEQGNLLDGRHRVYQAWLRGVVALPARRRTEKECVVAVHCFFGCPHVVRSQNPREAHALMEAHYSRRHARQIRRMTGGAA